MTATKIAPLVLICVVALAVASSVGFALVTGIGQKMEVGLSKRIEASSSVSLLSFVKPLGDPINDPKPNCK